MRHGSSAGRIALLAAGVTLAALLLPGCTNGTSPQPPATSPPTAAPLLEELAAGVTIPGHGAEPAGELHIVDASGYRSFGTDQVERIDLVSATQTWSTAFPSVGLEPSDALPTVGVSGDAATVHAVRSVTLIGQDGRDDVLGVQLMTLDAGTGAMLDSAFVGAPDQEVGAWAVPPQILSADSTRIVLSADPEVGASTTALRLPAATIAWTVDDQAYGADPSVVLVRTVAADWTVGMAGLDARTGELLWDLAEEATDHAYLGGTDTAYLIDEAGADGHRLLWVDPTTGAVTAATDLVQAPEELLDCHLAATVVACHEGDRGQSMSGYDLATGEQLWSITSGSRHVPTLTTTYRDWLYGTVSGAEPDGVVLDARTGSELASEVALPGILFSNDAGVLIAGATGQSWVQTAG